MILRDSITVRAQPEAVFRFFEEMEQHYLAWHPDHVLFRWVSGRGVKEGHVFYFEEYIAGKLLKKRVAFTRIVPAEHIEFAPTFWLLRLFLRRFVFRVERQANGCRFTAEIHLRMGPLAARLNRRDLDAVRQHMKVEGENMKRMLEERPAASSPSPR